MKRRFYTCFSRIIAGISIFTSTYDYTAGITPRSITPLDTLGFSLLQDGLPVTNATFGDETSPSDETIILGAGLIQPAQPDDSEPIAPSEYARYSQAAAPRLLQGFKLPQALNGGIASFSRTLRIADTVFVMGPHRADGSDMSVFTTIPIDELSLALIDSAPFAFADVAHIPVIAYALPSRDPRHASITLIDTQTSQMSTLRIPTTATTPNDTLVSQLAFSSHTNPKIIKLAALFTSKTQSYVHVFTITRDESNEISIGQGKPVSVALAPEKKEDGAQYSMSWTPDGTKLIVLTKKSLTQAQKSIMPGDTSASIVVYDGTSLRLLTPTPLEFSYIRSNALDGVIQVTNDLSRLLVDHYRIEAPESFARRRAIIEEALGTTNITRQLEQRRQTGKMPYRPIKQ